VKYNIRSWIGGTEVAVDGETTDVFSAISIARHLEGAAKAISIARHLEGAAKAARPAGEKDSGPQPTTEYVLPGGAKLIPDDSGESFTPTFVPALDPKTADVPTVDAVADAVKLVVGKHGVARAAALLKEHGGARAADVPAANRSAFIEAAQKAVAA
jgi:hypothetical protein